MDQTGLAAIGVVDRFTVKQPKTGEIAMVNPSAGPVTGGTLVHLFMKEIDTWIGSVYKCHWGNTTVLDSVVVDSPRIVKCVAPAAVAHQPGDVDLSVQGPSGQISQPKKFTYHVVNGTSGNITAISPISGATRGGQYIMVRGEGFGLEFGDVIECHFTEQTVPGAPTPTAPSTPAAQAGGGTSSGTTEIVNGYRISNLMVRCPTPPHAAGVVHLSVSRNFLPPSNSVPYTFIGANPGNFSHSGVITGVYPNRGPHYGESWVVITGNGFGTDFLDRFECLFGKAAPVQAIRVSETTLKCQVPASAEPVTNTAVTVNLRVRNTEVATESNSVSYDYMPSLGSGHVESIWPTHGTANGGTEVFIKGTDLLDLTSGGVLNFHMMSSMSCLFNNTAVPARVNSKVSASCIAPQHPLGSKLTHPDTVSFTLRREGAVSLSPEVVKYTYDPVPATAVSAADNSTSAGGWRLTFVNPTSLPLTGGQLTIFSQTLPPLSEDTSDTFWRCRFVLTEGAQTLEVFMAAKRLAQNMLRCDAPSRIAAGPAKVSVIRGITAESQPYELRYIDTAAAGADLHVAGVQPSKGSIGTPVYLTLSRPLAILSGSADAFSLMCVFGPHQKVSHARKISERVITCEVPELAPEDAANALPADGGGGGSSSAAATGPFAVLVEVMINGGTPTKDKTMFVYVPVQDLQSAIAMALDPAKAFTTQKISPVIVALISAVVWIVMTALSAALCCCLRSVLFKRPKRSFAQEMEEAEQELSFIKRKPGSSLGSRNRNHVLEVPSDLEELELRDD